MAKVSVVISAYNEEKKIKACLDSVKWAWEIIFVDNSSTDKTPDIAKEYTKKIFRQKNDPDNIDLQKNHGIEKASGDWVMILDGDEVLTEELAIEIRSVTEKNDQEINGFWIPRKNIIFGKWIEHSGWYPDYQLRLFRLGKGKFEKKHVHENIVIQGKTAHLSEHLFHKNYETVSQFLYKHLQIYAPNEAAELLRKGYNFDWKGAIRLPMSEFLSRYFAREGYKDGFHGLILALLMGAYHLAIFVYIWEQKDFVNVPEEDIAGGVELELKKSRKEFSYWLSKIKLEQEKNSIKKLGIKIKRKLNY